MKNSTKKMLVKAGAVVLALVLVTSASIISKNTALKATDEMMEAMGADASVEEVIIEEPIYEPAPEPVEEEPVIVAEEITVDETGGEEIPAEEGTEEPAAETETETETENPDETPEDTEEEYEFDVREMYEYYMSLENDEERAAFLQSLPEEDRAALLSYIEEMRALEESAPDEESEVEEEIAPEKKTVNLSISYTLGQMNEDKTSVPCTWKANTEGLDIPEGAVFVWEESRDGGSSWNVIQGESGESFSFDVTRANNSYLWRCSVTY